MLLVLLAGAARGRAQFVTWDPEADNPGWSRAVPRLKYSEIDVEAEQNSQTSANGSELKGSRLYVSPRIGAGWDGYIYHPYLLTYALLFEPGYVWQQNKLGGQSTRADQVTLNGTWTANLLQIKPYATTVSYNRSHDQVRYDVFDSATVDAQGWGVTTGYREGPVPVTVSFNQTHEDSSDFNQTMVTDQSMLNLEARNERQDQDLTDLTYQYNQFARDTLFGNTSFRTDSDYHHLGLLDSEHWERSILQSTFRFDDRNTGELNSSDLNAALDYSIQHTPTLRSYYNYSFSRFEDDGSDSLQNYAIAGVQHRLFESLISSLEVHGATLNTTSDGSSFDSISGGTTLTEDYNKRLGGWGHLSVSDSASYNLTDQQTDGSELLISDEPYVVPVNGLVLLKQPRELSILLVTDVNHRPLQPGLDYVVIQTTDPWQIQILTIGPSHIQPGQGIRVTYTVQTNPTGTYSTVANQFQIRLGLWQDLVAVFMRYSLVDNQTRSPDFLLQDDQIFQTGAEFNWRGLRVSADYTKEHSTLFDNELFNVAESYSRPVTTDSTIGIDLNQQWGVSSFDSGTTTNQMEHTTFFSYMLHYTWHPTAALSWNAEVGYLQQRGFGLNEDLFAARTYLNWLVGKFQMHLGYEHGYQDLQGELRDRDFVFLRVRRSF